MKPPRNLSELIDFDGGTLRVTSRESRHREFKQVIEKEALAAYCKSLAAFANTEGGVILFGISDKMRTIVGVDQDRILDDADISSRLRENFDPVPLFESATYEINGLHVHGVFVEKHANRPILCKKTNTRRIPDRKGVPVDQEVLRESAIYFRYSGQTRTIGYAELARLLDEREQSRMRSILETLKAVERVGYDRVGIVDATTMGSPGGATKLYVSRETAKHLNFIDRGRFVESDDEAAPAYIVAGTVQLNEVIHAPMEEADKNLPKEVGERLAPVTRELYGPGVKLSGQQVSKLLAKYGFCAEEKFDPRYCVHERKLKRKFVTREGIRALEERMRADPLDAIRTFGAKAAVEAYGIRLSAKKRKANAAGS